jgi:hypothetical protein
MSLLSLFPLRYIKLALFGGVLAALQGCGMIYKSTGDILISYGRSEMLPYVMTYDDTQMACALGESMTPLLMSFEAVGSDPDKLAVLQYVSAGSCAETDALQHELHYLRAVKQGNVTEAQDARIAQKRAAALAAQRQYEAYRRAIKEFGEQAEGECPKLKKDFDQLVWMVGMVAGVQSLMNDGISGGQVGVPRDLAAKVERGAACLENEKWWGVPRGIRGAIWNILPPLAPANAEPWQELEKAAQIGFQQGVRLGSAMYAMAAYSKGDNERLRKSIRDFAANDSDIDQSYKLLDAMAVEIITGISDRLWTENTGKRTPIGGLGTFWDDASKNQPKVNIDDLL